MVNSTQFETTPCPKIDALDVNAYFTLDLDPVNTSVLRLDTSWGCTSVDLTPAVQAAETITHLFLTPSIKPNALQFNREDYGRSSAEDGGFDCITGEELSRIISMQFLRDVDQLNAIKDGMVYMYNGLTSLFEPYDLKTFVGDTNTTLGNHQSAITELQGDVTAIKNNLALLTQRVANLEERMTAAEQNIQNLLQRMATAESNISNLQGRVSNIEGAIYNWASDKSTPITRGNINVYGDSSNTNNHTRGLFTHNPNTNVNGDLYFA